MSDIDSVAVIDAATNEVIKTIHVGSFPDAVSVNDATNRIYVNNSFDDSVSVIGGDTDTVIATVKNLQYFSRKAGINRATNRVYVPSDDNIYVLNGETNSLLKKITSDGIGVGSSFPDADSATVNETTNAFYVTVRLNSGGGIVRFNGATNVRTTVKSLSKNPRECQVNSTTDRLYVLTEGGFLAELDGTTLAVLKEVQIHGSDTFQTNGDHLAIDETTNQIYTVNSDDTFSVFDGDTLDELYTVDTGSFNLTGISVDPVSGRIYLSDQWDESVLVYGYATTGDQPTLSVSDASLPEGDSGNTNATFNVTLSAPSTRTVSVKYATEDGTATQPSDYTSTSGTLTFTPGATTRSVTVPVVGDTNVETNETFKLKLSAAFNATLADEEGLGTIGNDDSPSFSINDVSIREGNSGNAQAVFTVTLSPPADHAVTVNYATANSSAFAGQDYTAVSGTLTFSANATTRTIVVPVTGETAIEPDETFVVNLSDAGDATISDFQGVATIVNDDEDVPPTVAILAPSAGGAVKTLALINGIASDNEGGSGLSKVQMRLRRNADNKYWTGTTWGVATDLTTTLAGGNWKRATGLPAGSNLPEGTYTVTATAYDQSENSATISSNFKIDTTVPTALLIKSPASGAIVRALATISGTATDNVNGSGLGAVKLRLQRSADKLYWNGITWGAASALLEGTVSNSAWSRKGELPTGFDLQDGSYVLTATIYDKAGNSISSTSTFKVDVTSPDTLVIATPAAGSGVTSLTSVTGFAADGQGGSGLASVKLRLRKNIGNVYWTGTEWGTPTNLDAAVEGIAWSKNSGWPTGEDLGEDGYVLYAVATDRAGNSKTISTTFKVDRSAPATIVIKTPASGAVIGALTVVSGTTTDNSGGSGVEAVRLRLRRFDNTYWTGSTWGAATDLDAIVIGSQWSKAGGWPSGANLASGEYLLSANAVDRAGNSMSVSSSFKVDGTPPATLTIQTPANGSTVGTLTSVTGTATDNAGGSGIASVKIRLCRLSDNLYWIGNAWGASVALEGTVSGSQWSKTKGWPTIDKLSEGDYQLFVTALDKAGNTRETSSIFTVVLAPVVRSLPASSVVLSSASARSINGGAIVSLTFTGTLSTSATDAGRYTLSVGGVSLDIVSVQQPTASEAVLFVDGAKRGQTLTVSYKLVDGRGKAVTGTISVPVK